VAVNGTEEEGSETARVGRAERARRARMAGRAKDKARTAVDELS